MACIHWRCGDSSVYVCGINPVYRLPLADGRRVYMEWHSYLGPTLFYDKRGQRMIDDWFQDPQICEAVQWFQDRGEKA